MSNPYMDNKKHCDKCDSVNHNTDNCPFVGGYKAGIFYWKPIVVEDLDVTPIKIESKRQYKEELKKRGLECRGLM
jgi:hypothetical protein